MRHALVFFIILMLPALAGCMQQGGAEPIDPNDGTPLPTPSSHFEVRNLAITPEGEHTRTLLYEDDRGALVRYVIVQPADAPRETAFVTYVFNGKITDVSQLTLAPGEEHIFERVVNDLRATPRISVEVRVGASVARSEASVQEWPRAGADALTLGPLTIRADYGLLQQDRRALVNLTLTYVEAPERFEDLRMRLVCLDSNRAFVTTSTVAIDPPTPGEIKKLDVVVDDCRIERYGIEFLASGEDGRPLQGRLLLVARGWERSA